MLYMIFAYCDIDIWIPDIEYQILISEICRLVLKYWFLYSIVV